MEEKVKSFCAIPRVLGFLKEYILFAEKDEELNKWISPGISAPASTMPTGAGGVHLHPGYQQRERRAACGLGRRRAC